MDNVSKRFNYECMYERGAKGVRIVYEKGSRCTKGATKGLRKGTPS